MENNSENGNVSDDEDLEVLRLAALQSLKKSVPTQSTQLPTNNYGGNSMCYNNNKRRGYNGRPGRNNNNRSRNTNLIAVKTVDETECNSSSIESKPKLILPQERYCNNKQVTETKPSDGSSKFDRFNDTESESDSDSEVENSDLKRSNSLEVLMQELENEIQADAGDNNPIKKVQEEEEEKTKPVISNDSDDKLVESRLIADSCDKEEEAKTKEIVNEKVESEEVKAAPPRKIIPKRSFPSERNRGKSFRRKTDSPLRNNFQYAQNHPGLQNQINMSLPVYPAPFIPNIRPVPFINPPLIKENVPYTSIPSYKPMNSMYLNENPAFNPISLNYGQQPPPPRIYDRPLSPLSINTDVLHTVSAPLSPRSAAFVLQNRQIIERRKKSPKRSYSRSPSPRYQQRSPKRSPINKKLKRLSPERKDASPKTDFTGKKRREVEKPSRQSPTVKDSETVVKETVKEDPVPDSVLKARKKKFETPSVPTVGIIKLKSIETESVQRDDQPLECDDLLNLNTGKEDLFSDEDSDSDNEGRFKLKQQEDSKRVSTLSFLSLTKEKRIAKKVQTPPIKSKEIRKTESPKKSNRESKSKVKVEEPVKSVEVNSKVKVVSNKTKKEEKPEKSEESKKKKKLVRKVEVCVNVDELANGKNKEENTKVGSSAADLRTQLSRKRAQRQNRIVTKEIQSRLLHNALESVFKKSKSEQKEKSVASEGKKVPIRLRLGIPNSPETKLKGSSKRRSKNKEPKDQ